MTAVQELKDEHQAILLMLDILKKISDRLDSGQAMDLSHLEKAVEFIRVFADKCHHGKEEDHLFRAMEEAGIPSRGGPIGVMLQEHELGRNHVRAMAESIPGLKRGDKAARLRFAENARGYATLLNQHIHKEDNILYPMADARLSPAQQAELSARFADVEKNVIGPGRHQEFHRLLHQLQETYLTGSKG